MVKKEPSPSISMVMDWVHVEDQHHVHNFPMWAFLPLHQQKSHIHTCIYLIACSYIYSMVVYSMMNISIIQVVSKPRLEPGPQAFTSAKPGPSPLPAHSQAGLGWAQMGWAWVGFGLQAQPSTPLNVLLHISTHCLAIQKSNLIFLKQ
jgi:hypothetical protein